MERLEARGRAIGEAARRRAVRRLAERLSEVREVRVEAEAERVTVWGRGLWRMPGLRWIGGLLR
jgi:hypothetical protein